MSDPAARASAAFVDEDYPAAVQLYTEALTGAEGVGAAAIHSHRAAAHIKLAQHDQALEDANTALRLTVGTSNELTWLALYRKGCVPLPSPPPRAPAAVTCTRV